MSGTVSVRGLCVTLANRPVLSGVDLDLDQGELVCLMGVSGAGKSTVLRAIAALQPFTAGSISVGRYKLRAGPLPRESQLGPVRRSVGMVFQNHSLFEHLTMLENVTLAPVYVHRWSPERAREVARNLLSSLGVGACAEAFPRQVSGGEAQRVAIARALVADPATLLLDEPTSALDPGRRAALGETLRRLARDRRGLLVATHDVPFARAFADRVVVLAAGAVVEAGPALRVLEAPEKEATRELLRLPVESEGEARRRT